MWLAEAAFCAVILRCLRIFSATTSLFLFIVITPAAAQQIGEFNVILRRVDELLSDGQLSRGADRSAEA